VGKKKQQEFYHKNMPVFYRRQAGGGQKRRTKMMDRRRSRPADSVGADGEGQEKGLDAQYVREGREREEDVDVDVTRLINAADTDLVGEDGADYGRGNNDSSAGDWQQQSVNYETVPDETSGTARRRSVSAGARASTGDNIGRFLLSRSALAQHTDPPLPSKGRPRTGCDAREDEHAVLEAKEAEEAKEDEQVYEHRQPKKGTAAAADNPATAPTKTYAKSRAQTVRKARTAVPRRRGSVTESQAAYEEEMRAERRASRLILDAERRRSMREHSAVDNRYQPVGPPVQLAAQSQAKAPPAYGTSGMSAEKLEEERNIGIGKSSAMPVGEGSDRDDSSAGAKAEMEAWLDEMGAGEDSQELGGGEKKDGVKEGVLELAGSKGVMEEHNAAGDWKRQQDEESRVKALARQFSNDVQGPGLALVTGGASVTAAAATSKASQTAQEEKELKGLVQGRQLLGLMGGAVDAAVETQATVRPKQETSNLSADDRRQKQLQKLEEAKKNAAESPVLRRHTEAKKMVQERESGGSPTALDFEIEAGGPGDQAAAPVAPVTPVSGQPSSSAVNAVCKADVGQLTSPRAVEKAREEAERKAMFGAFEEKGRKARGIKDAEAAIQAQAKKEADEKHWREAEERGRQLLRKVQEQKATEEKTRMELEAQEEAEALQRAKIEGRKALEAKVQKGLEERAQRDAKEKAVKVSDAAVWLDPDRTVYRGGPPLSLSKPAQVSDAGSDAGTTGIGSGSGGTRSPRGKNVKAWAKKKAKMGAAVQKVCSNNKTSYETTDPLNKLTKTSLTSTRTVLSRRHARQDTRDHHRMPTTKIPTHQQPPNTPLL
jgi:hypothetical protein